MLLILFLPSASSLLLLVVLHLDLRHQVSRIFAGSDEHQPKLLENPLLQASGQGENLVVIQDSVEIPRWAISRFLIVSDCALFFFFFFLGGGGLEGARTLSCLV